MSDPDMPTDSKYMVFKREELYQMMGLLGLPPWNAPDGTLVGADWDSAVFAQAISVAIEATALKDAVVIRRQDKFASPCLLTYAAMIGMVGKEHPDPKVSAELLAIADYFQRQGELAGDEAWKLPDL
jgi:hypothetical protein